MQWTEPAGTPARRNGPRDSKAWSAPGRPFNVGPLVGLAMAIFGSIVLGCFALIAANALR